MSKSMRAQTIHITGHGGNEIEAYLATPDGGEPRGGVVVIHHMPGYDRASHEITRRFTDLGLNALMPNLYWREAPGAEPDDAAATARAQGGVPDERLVGDVAGAAAYLRGLSTSNGKIGTIGYCSGGRQSVLAGCNVDVNAVVDCYGAFVTGTPPEGFPMRKNLEDQLHNLRAPLLGLFGEDDQYPSSEQVERLREILQANGKEFDFTSYPGAGHAFFSVDRPSYRVDAANDGWARIAAFYGKHLAA